MRTIQTLAIVSLLLTAFPALPRESSQPDAPAIAKLFYETLLKLNPNGLPTEEQMKQLGPLLSKELNNLIAAARKEQQKFIKDNPDEKPPFIEGNLFGSMFEGMHSFSLGQPAFNDEKASIPAYLEYREGQTVVKWIDVIVLEKAGEQWLVADIFLNGPWDFKAGPSLKSVLSSE